jgi:hypothetical protein
LDHRTARAAKKNPAQRAPSAGPRSAQWDDLGVHPAIIKLLEPAVCLFAARRFENKFLRVATASAKSLPTLGLTERT